MNRTIPLALAAAAALATSLALPVQANAAAYYTNCSAVKTLGYGCITWVRSANAAGDSVVKPSTCMFTNLSGANETVGPLVYGWHRSGNPIQKQFDPNYYPLGNGDTWSYDCGSVFTSWGYTSPGMYVNTYASDGEIAQAFTVYS